MSIVDRFIRVQSEDSPNPIENVLVIDKVTVHQNSPVTAYLCLKEDGQTIVITPFEIDSIVPYKLEAEKFEGWKKHDAQ